MSGTPGLPVRSAKFAACPLRPRTPCQASAFAGRCFPPASPCRCSPERCPWRPWCCWLLSGSTPPRRLVRRRLSRLKGPPRQELQSRSPCRLLPSCIPSPGFRPRRSCPFRRRRCPLLQPPARPLPRRLQPGPRPRPPHRWPVLPPAPLEQPPPRPCCWPRPQLALPLRRRQSRQRRRQPRPLRRLPIR